jgi:hypothetical protein
MGSRIARAAEPPDDCRPDSMPLDWTTAVAVNGIRHMNADTRNTDVRGSSDAEGPRAMMSDRGKRET